MFAELFCQELQHFSGMDHILHITADNASTNLAMAWHIQFESEQSFQAEDQLLGCVAHVLNLAAQDGLKALGSDNLNLDEVNQAGEAMAISNLVSVPDGSNINLRTVVARIQNWAVYV